MRTDSGLLRRAATPVLLLTIFLVGLVPALRGLDFGAHWDEHHRASTLQTALESKVLLPGWYYYPSACFWITLGAVAPELVRTLGDVPAPLSDGGWPEVVRRIGGVLASPEFLLRLRGVFSALTLLAVIWVGLAARALGRPRLEACVGAALIATSFEIGYHARWAMPDAVMMQFTALTMLFLVLAETRRAAFWPLALAALSAGAATSTKYPGGLLLLPVLLAVPRTGGTLRARLIEVFGVLSLFAAAYLAITPGTVLDPIRFREHLLFEIQHYRTGHHGYNVEPGLTHLGLELRYLAGELLSPFGVLAYTFAALALLGAGVLVRERPRLGAILLAFCIAYLAYFATRRVLIVRNLLPLAPFLALFAARGSGALLAWLPARGPRLVGVAALVVALVSQAGYQLHAAQTIRERGSDRFARELGRWLEARSDERFWVSPRARRELADIGFGPHAGWSEDRGEVHDGYVFHRDEPMRIRRFRGNWPGMTRATFGPLDVNFEWYVTWRSPRFVVLTPEAARELGMVR